MEEITYNDFFNKIESNSLYDRFMYLKVYVVGDNQLKERYRQHIHNHLSKILNKVSYADAGFDIFVPNTEDENGLRIIPNEMNMIDFKIKCSAKMVILNRSLNLVSEHPTGFYTYPRSSICKTKLRLANNTGIIDAGYRGSLKGPFDVLPSVSEPFYVESYSRLLQICAPSLVPIYVELVHTPNQLGEITERGDGGFGSTGI